MFVYSTYRRPYRFSFRNSWLDRPAAGGENGVVSSWGSLAHHCISGTCSWWVLNKNFFWSE